MTYYHWSGPSRTVDLRPVHVTKPRDNRLRTVAAGIVSGCVASTGAAGWLIPLVARQRGYIAVGGEWLVIAVIGGLVGVAVAWWIERRVWTP